MSTTLTSADQAAATVISIMNQATEKRGRDDVADGADAAGGDLRPAKMSRPEGGRVLREIKPYPFFFYRDHSMELDDDPLVPLTPPGRVPNFPAKMHAILSRQDFADIVSWLPHGRSWRVLKPREFEIKVIPMFFEHAKFSSFVRQANGWGFRRITQGKDRNSYYHEKFLRGLPHLCKTMKRPGVNEKKSADPEYEPDLYKISELHPVPDKADDDSILLHCTVQGGPKARMPIYCGPTLSSHNTATSVPSMFGTFSPGVTNNVVAPVEQKFVQPFVVQQQAAAPEQKPGSPMNISPETAAPKPTLTMSAMPSFLAMPSPPSSVASAQPQQQQQTLTLAPQNNAANFAALAAANQMAMQIPGMSASAASQFAAGFAAATAFSQQHFSAVLENMVKQQQQQQQQTQQQSTQQS